MSTSNLGELDSVPKIRNNATLTTGDPTDIYKFSIDSRRSINLSLNEISSGDDADLQLYRDSNGNGRLDINGDQLVDSSLRGSNQDDMINFRANAGTYFARVQRFASGSSGSVTYDLDLSATRPEAPDPQRRPSNLLPTEVNVGTLSGTRTFSGSNNDSELISDSNTSDVYRFRMGTSGNFSLDLTGLSADADVRLVRDNGNRLIESNEIITDSTNGGSSDESIDVFLTGGVNYFVQVYQYAAQGFPGGTTDYTLSLSA